jgi:putative PIN family toxin of toxin-antitoxin system
MHKVVVDTNIFISAVIKEQSNPGRVLNLVKEKKIELIVSPDILAEIETVLFYPRLKKIHQLEAKAIKAYLKKIELISQTVTPTKPLHIINKDPSDNIYLECAVEGQADFIVSGDRHLTGLETYAGIRIMDPGTFLKAIQDES